MHGYLMAIKSLEEYIDRWGIDGGTKRYNGALKSNKSKAEKYAKQPYKRLSKDWYIWRYGEEEGLRRFTQFASKCAHTLENFISNHGVEKGTLIYNETMRKKNTILACIEKYGEEEGNRRNQEKYLKSSFTNSLEGRIEKYGVEEGTRIHIAHCAKMKESHRPYVESITGKPAIERFTDKYGEEEGTIRYYACLVRQFSGPSRASRPLIKIIECLREKISLSNFDNLYFDYNGKNEYWMVNKDTKEFYSFDIVHLPSKTILEYDGSYWHPSYEEVLEDPNRIHQIIKKPIIEIYTRGERKKQYARDCGFHVVVSREDTNEDEAFKEFLERIEIVSE